MPAYTCSKCGGYVYFADEGINKGFLPEIAKTGLCDACSISITIEEPVEKSEPIKSTESTEKKYIIEELNKMSFAELKIIGKKFGTTDRSKSNLINEILKLQR